MKTDSFEYRRICILCGIYALFYTFCLYKNYSGVTFPFFVAGTLCFSVYFMKKQGLTLKKFSYFLISCSLLLGVNIALTSSWVLSLFDRCFIFLLIFMLLLHNLYDDRTWDVTRYTAAISTIVATAVGYVFRPFTDLADLYKNRRQIPQEAAAVPGAAEQVPGAVPPGAAVNVPQGNPRPADNVYVASPDGNMVRESYPAPHKKGTFSYVLLGLVISIPILAVVLPLLITSDAVFSSAMKHAFTFDWNADVIGVIVMIIAVFMFAYAVWKRLEDRLEALDVPVPDRRIHNPVVAITVSCVMLFFYLIYCVIQIVYLFMGYGTLPEGYTYAEYAHEGFYQLVFICLINIALVLICRKFSQDSKALKIALALISGCTFVMIFSAVYRMLLYISVYRFTFLRLYVLWALLVITLTMIGTVIHIFCPGMPFVKYCVTVLVSTWIVFAFMNPDYRIAKYNLTHTNWAGYKADAENIDDLPSDNVYVRLDLSADAASAVARYSQSDLFTKECLTAYTDYYYEDRDIWAGEEENERLSIRHLNYSAWNVYRLLERY